MRKSFQHKLLAQNMRLRCKVVKILDAYYFKELSKDELNKASSEIFTVRKDIHTYDEFSDYMSIHQNTFMPEEKQQIRVTLIPNFSETQSIALFKVHHVIGDGLGLILMIAFLQDQYNKNVWIQTTSVRSFWTKLFLNVIKPFTITYAFLFFLFWGTDNNFIKKKTVELAGYKKNSICKPFSIEELKRVGKKYGGTVNDVILALTSVSLKQFLRDNYDMDSKSMNLLVPFSMRELPNCIEEHVAENDFSIICFTL